MILQFQTKHTKPLIAAWKHDRFTACGKVPTAFDRNTVFFHLEVFFVIFKAVYRFVFMDFVDFIRKKLWRNSFCDEFYAFGAQA